MILKNSEIKEFLVLMDQYNIEIFSCFLRLLPFCFSTICQTDVESAQNRSADNPSISRIQSLHLLLEVDHHDEEEYSIVLTLGERYANKFLDLHQSKIFHRKVDEQAEVSIRGFAVAFDRLAKESTFVSNANSSDCISEGFLLVVVVPPCCCSSP